MSLRICTPIPPIPINRIKTAEYSSWPWNDEIVTSERRNDMKMTENFCLFSNKKICKCKN